MTITNKKTPFQKKAGLINLLIQQITILCETTYKVPGKSVCVEIPGLSNSPYPIESSSFLKPV